MKYCILKQVINIKYFKLVNLGLDEITEPISSKSLKIHKGRKELKHRK